MMSTPATSVSTPHDRRSGLAAVVADRGVRTKILAAVGSLGVVAAVVGSVAIQSTASLRQQADDVVTLQQTLVTDRAEVHQNQLKARAPDRPDRRGRHTRREAGVPGEVPR